MRREVFEVGPEEKGMRLDLFVAGRLPEFSRTMAAELIKDGMVLVDGAGAKPGLRMNPGQKVAVSIPDPRPVEVVPQEIPLKIVYEDHDLAVIDKPRGMVVHPAHGNWDGTLVNALLYQIDDLSGINGELRPGIVHRLDKDTSGLLVVAKNDIAHRSLAEQIKAHSVIREYTALVHGIVSQNLGRIEAPVGRSPRDRKKMAVVAGGKPAVTNYRVLERFKNYTLVSCRLETGRTHQIRVHMSYIGHPVVGDLLYGPRKNEFGLEGQFLHAGMLEFDHPQTGQRMQFKSPLPAELQYILDRLE